MSITNTDVFTFLFLIISLVSSFFIKRISPSNVISIHNDTALEGLRGVACLFVFINHASYSLQHIGIPNWQMMGPNPYTGRMGAFGVEIFFCLTGYLFARKIRNGGIDLSFFEKRIRRLAPAYLVISSIVFLYFLLSNYSVIRGYYDISALIQQIFGFGFFGSRISVNGMVDTSLNAVVWTLPYEWKFYAIVPFIAAIYKIKRPIPLLIAFGVATVCIDYWSKIFLWGFFVTGFIASFVGILENRYLKYISYYIMLFLFAYAFKGTFDIHGFQMFIVVSLFFITFIATRPKIFSIGVFVYLGTISYSIYLLHQVVTTIFMKSISGVINLININMYEYLIICIIPISLTIYLSSISYNKVEKRFIR
ncbi:acyltransferase family protein [Escherichia coli]|uniref:acyltransferase family protein n=1 Tax=Escherichia coli TaxID=562 RepID=UPI0039BF4BA1